MSGVPVEASLRAGRDAGRKLLVPYVTGGFGSRWLDVLAAMVSAGADAVEVGIPFSDPVMDGPTIQEASVRALQLGATPVSIVAELSRVPVEVPLVAMTYYNLVFRGGHRRFAHSLTDAGVKGVIIPALEPAHAVAWVARAARSGEIPTGSSVLITMSGRGDKDAEQVMGLLG